MIDLALGPSARVDACARSQSLDSGWGVVESTAIKTGVLEKEVGWCWRISCEAILDIDAHRPVEREVIVVEIRHRVAAAQAAAKWPRSAATGRSRTAIRQQVGRRAGAADIVVSGDDIQRNAANEGRAGLIGIQIVVPAGKPEIAIVAVAARDVHVVAGIEHESGSLQIRLAGKGQCAYVVHGVNDASLIVGDEAGVGGIYLRNTRIVALVSLDLE